MYTNPFVTQLLANERMKDALRRNEQARLIRTVKNSRQTQPRWFLMILASKNSSTRFNRSQRNQLTANIPSL
jgi:hypothetical protein